MFSDIMALVSGNKGSYDGFHTDRRWFTPPVTRAIQPTNHQPDSGNRDRCVRGYPCALWRFHQSDIDSIIKGKDDARSYNKKR